MHEEILAPLAVGVGAFGAVVSAATGGGGGLFFLPAMLMAGVPPHYAVAAAKFNDVGINIGALGMIGATGRAIRRLLRKRTFSTPKKMPSPRSWVRANVMITAIVIITLFNVLIASWLIPLLAHVEWTNILIAYLLLGMALFGKSKVFREGKRSTRRRKLGYSLYWIVSLAQAVFGMGIGIFISLVVMYGFGYGVREANRLKRLATFYQSLLLIIALAFQGSILLVLSAAALLGAVCGAKVGTWLVRGKSDVTMKKLLRGIMAASAIMLLVV